MKSLLWLLTIAWLADSRWFFAFSAGVAALALAAVIREKMRLAKKTNEPAPGATA